MRTILLSLIVVTPLALSASGCKKDEDASSSGAKVNEAARDGVDDTAPPTTPPPPTERVDQPRTDLAQARAELEATTRSRLAAIDAQIAKLEARADQASKDAAAKLRQQRDQVADTMSRLGDQTERGWDEFKADVNQRLDELDREIDQAVD